MSHAKSMKLNIGCGTDYKEGYINIDGSSTLEKVDKIIDIVPGQLLQHFQHSSIESILAYDILEHFFHWESIKLLHDFFSLLKMNGELHIRVPDCGHIIRSLTLSLEKKLILLYGGQEKPLGVSPEMDQSREQFPHYFCHKYGWSKERIKYDLESIGFTIDKIKREKTNLVVRAIKVNDQ